LKPKSGNFIKYINQVFIYSNIYCKLLKLNSVITEFTKIRSQPIYQFPVCNKKWVHGSASIKLFSYLTNTKSTMHEKK